MQSNLHSERYIPVPTLDAGGMTVVALCEHAVLSKELRFVFLYFHVKSNIVSINQAKPFAANSCFTSNEAEVSKCVLIFLISSKH